jgi:hypothetical protein
MGIAQRLARTLAASLWVLAVFCCSVRAAEGSAAREPAKLAVVYALTPAKNLEGHDLGAIFTLESSIQPD